MPGGERCLVLNIIVRQMVLGLRGKLRQVRLTVLTPMMLGTPKAITAMSHKLAGIM